MSEPASFNISEPSSAEIRSHLKSTPWALKILNDPTLRPLSHRRTRPKGTTSHTFQSQTLNSEHTIPTWLSFSRPPSSQNESEEILFILKLESGVNGHADICHGGFVSFLLDEVMGIASEHARLKRMAAMTASLKVNFKAPVMTPSVILCRSMLTRRKGRKLWIRGSIEDGEGLVFATGEALFLEVEAVKRRERL